MSSWWQGAVIYQIYPRSFRDSDGDGVGDLRGLLAGIDHIASLGVDAIWLSPIYVSPQADFGYDIADHCAIDPAYGTQADFDALVEAAHARGLKVMLDLVVGHTSVEHPWFLESRARRTGPLADRYIWADPRPDGTPPNNWLSVFGGPAWRWESRRRQYYLHHFLSAQPALNLAEPATRDAVAEIMRFWLSRGVDGFRIDALDFLHRDPQLRDNPAAPPKPEIPSKLFGMQLHQFDMMGPETPTILRHFRATADAFGDRALLGELSSQPGAHARVARSTGPGLLHMAYTLAPLRGAFDHPIATALVQAAANPEGWACWCFSNHDVVRTATRWAPGQVPDARVTRLLLALLLTLRGSICLYQGEELGLPEAELPFAALRDPFGIEFWPDFAGRDGSRTPMPWRQAEPQAGFTTGTPWLPVPDTHLPLAVDVQEADADSPLHFTRALLKLRHGHPAMITGDLVPLDLPAPLLGFDRVDAASGARLRCLFNLSGQPAPVPPVLLAGAQPLADAILPDPQGTLPEWGVALARMP
ncbi:alpha-amylase family glycosyl hydrolase [Falsiroseomonas sp.]|uniref:alpha-amylase family glycosyl hydrolase n=1 Tax=Falsiroseomonas sp. TaxID=2870721 RepID=UPI002723DFF2|nr:alpha-amylase family glycosyl hydrolase [Falsiroseomonas sp.]MDO9501238.1 alpha-amylase family glycosyl hydrolase [Falsiroseomonas sp.]